MCETAGHEHAHSHGEHHHSAAPSRPGQLRVVVTGKGGVGKTSLVALLASHLSRTSWKVLALDADPQINLPGALGLGRSEAAAIVPLSRNAEYAEEKTGSRPGSGFGGFLRLNPDVDDVVDRFGVLAPCGVRLLVMGTVQQPAAGCLCPESSLLAAVAAAVSLRKNEAILMDTQAGVEHFGRALARGFHHAAVVTDPTSRGVLAALHSAHLARQMGIPAVHLVVNRARSGEDLGKVRKLIAEEGGFAFTSEHALPFDERVPESEPAVTGLLDPADSRLAAAIAGLQDALVRSEEELAP